MAIFSRFRKPLAAFFLCLFTTELVAPTVSYALTSGPDQPEMKGFTPIGNTDMVDLFSGDFNYNIPLLDVGGYPVNLSYQSGAGMDDEASWVGVGWSLGPGALNRQMRGVPDDFNGTDMQEREMNMKDHITKGGKFSMTLDLLGIPVLKSRKKVKKKKLDFDLTFSVGVKSDNYRGMGADIGANIGLSLTEAVAGEHTKSGSDSTTSNKGLGSLGINSSSFDGVSADLNATILRKGFAAGDVTHGLSKSIGFGYNTRAGLTGMTLGISYNVGKMEGEKYRGYFSNGNSSFISFNSPTYSPIIDHSTKTDSYTLSLSAGGELWVVLLGGGITGFYSKQQVSNKYKSSPAYGFMHSEKGIDDEDALMDFNREKDIPYTKELNNLPIPVPTYDLYSATSQDGGGQYRLYRGSSGVFFDQKVESKNDDYSVGVEFGFGTYFDVGADLFYQNTNTTTKKWTAYNKFLSKGDFKKKTASANPLFEPAYFKRVGEAVPFDNSFATKLRNTAPVAVALSSNISAAIEGAEATDRLRTEQIAGGVGADELIKENRDVKNTTFLPLTAKEASEHGLDKQIRNYKPDSINLNNCGTRGIEGTIDRVGAHRKAHHISEVVITGDDGKRSVYGIPVYNTYQEEVSFSVAPDLTKRNDGIIPYVNNIDNSVNNKKGRENYYSKQKMPAYSTTHLLSAILSPDYVDATDNGVTDDDLGTAVKFNYSKLANNYRWRTPYHTSANMANYNEGFLSDNLDDKANYVYGEKEIWYMHSIESKTMVAQFITEDRLDAWGVTGAGGTVDSTNRLQYLKEIRLFSKSDLQLNNNNPHLTTPIKVVHFEYDYSLCQGLPNSRNNGGKLTLKKVYFTFGHNQKGRLNSYQFNYKTNFNTYGYRLYDRWGNYKPTQYNPGGMNNSEFPYTLQDTSYTNNYVSEWQLSQIKLPSGGMINISYESDDYAYVQDKHAGQMFNLVGLNSVGDSVNLINATHLCVKLPEGIAGNDAVKRRKLFEGITNLYFKCLVDLDGKGHKEYVPGYTKIAGEPQFIGDGTVVKIPIEKVSNKFDINAIAKTSWQFLRTNLPKYAYPGSENLEDEGSDLEKGIKALVTAFANFKEVFTGFEKTAYDRKFANKLDVSRSWVRLNAPEGKKLGGGTRVRKVEITDEWTNMSGTANAPTATYTQVYDYTTTNSYGEPISSGVASYEPLVGNDENPFRQPVAYKEKKFLGLDNYYYIEEPFGESFFPGASVGYSKVTVKSIGAGDEETVNRTGVVISEFHTAKDFPTILKKLGIESKVPIQHALFKLIGGISLDMIGLSQGYTVELNDMHGKPKSTQILNKSGQTISSQEFYYQTENEFAEKKALSNTVKVINNQALISDGIIGMDMEMYTDMREQTTDNLGTSAKISGGSGAILWFPLPFAFPGIGMNYDRRNFRSTSTIKIIQRFGIQTRVRKMENGSSIWTENLLWDAETGNVLLTKTQNEFDDPVYSFAYPAHWIYDGMGQAFKNLGTLLTDFSTGSNGTIANSAYNSLLVPGDELVDINSSNKYWIINSPISSVYAKRIINAEGELQSLSGLALKLIRSGRRNMANTAIGTIVSLANPVQGNQINVSAALTKVLDAKATVFNEEWSMPAYCASCPEGYQLSPDGLKCYQDSAPIENSGCYTICRGDSLGYYAVEGTRLYDTGYSVSGTGAWTLLDTSFWKSDCPPPPESFTDNGEDSSSMQLSKNTTSLPALESACTRAPIPYTNSVNCAGPLTRVGIWACRENSASRDPQHIWIGVNRCVTVPESKTYFIGIAGDNRVSLSIDGSKVVELLGDSSKNFLYWHIYPVYLSSGSHTLELAGFNSGSQATFGAEIYDNSREEITNAGSYSDLDTLFSTRSLVGSELTMNKYACSSGALNTCGTPFCRNEVSVNSIINPYFKGVLGNWRAESQYVYQVNRENLAGNPTLSGSTNIRKSGAYAEFNPFWHYADVESVWEQNPTNDNRWIAANKVTQFNSKGLETENRDALNRYSSALFGYLESMPIAVASNARNREIAYDGMEDYGFSLGCTSDTCKIGHFDFRKLINGTTVQLSNQKSHTGKFSLKLSGNLFVKKTVYTGSGDNFYSFDAGRFSLASNEQTKGFSPIPGKKYVLSFWLRESTHRDPTTNFQVKVNGTSLLSPASQWPVVEGWKRIEVQFTVPLVASEFQLDLLPGGSDKFIDDIRIMPFDGQMKTFAYNASNQRLMAEHDENNFATFYEYDDEGTLIRVKKETERGIMTIKETRSSYRKIN